jgi:formamidopyrimidine-DNA glycosylase
MPELPEVETWRRLAEQHVAGKTIKSVFALKDEIIFDNCTQAAFTRKLTGRCIDQVLRKGKHLWMDLDQAPHPYFHFGMTGSFHVYRSEKLRPRFLKAELLMDDGTRLGFRNVRRIGRVRLHDDPTAVPPISKLGFDPFLDMASLAFFKETFARRKAPIKALLLDQKFAAGVGNWIADEILYQAGIDPARRANTLSSDEIKRIRNKMGSIIRKAVDVSADADHFPRTWLFHYRWGKNKEALTAKGQKIEFATIGGRTTAFVPDVQQ